MLEVGIEGEEFETAEKPGKEVIRQLLLYSRS